MIQRDKTIDEYIDDGTVREKPKGCDCWQYWLIVAFAGFCLFGILAYARFTN